MIKKNNNIVIKVTNFLLNKKKQKKIQNYSKNNIYKKLITSAIIENLILKKINFSGV